MTWIRFQFKTQQGRTPRTSSSKICAISKSTRKVRTLGLCRQPHQKSCSGKGLAPMGTTSLRWHHRLTTMLRTSIKAWQGSKLTCSRHHLCRPTQLLVINNSWISLSLARHLRTQKLMTASSSTRAKSTPTRPTRVVSQPLSLLALRMQWLRPVLRELRATISLRDSFLRKVALTDLVTAKVKSRKTSFSPAKEFLKMTNRRIKIWNQAMMWFISTRQTSIWPRSLWMKAAPTVYRAIQMRLTRKSLRILWSVKTFSLTSWLSRGRQATTILQ